MDILVWTARGYVIIAACVGLPSWLSNYCRGNGHPSMERPLMGDHPLLRCVTEQIIFKLKIDRYIKYLVIASESIPNSI